MRPKSLKTSILFATFLAASPTIAACSTHSEPQPLGGADASAGTVGFRLQVAPGVSVSTVAWTIHNPALLGADRTGTVDVSHSSVVQFIVGGLPAGGGYSITLAATTSTGVACAGSAAFGVVSGSTTGVVVNLVCKEDSVDAGSNGSVIVNGTVSVVDPCAAVTSLSASPSTVDVGGTVSLSAQGVDSAGSSTGVVFSWSASASAPASPTGTGSGTFSSSTSASPTFTCTKDGTVTVTVTAEVTDAGAHCVNNTATATLTCTPACPGGDPPNYRAPCGSCGGSIACSGECSVPTPQDLGHACGSCGGTVQCDGSCSVATPASFGQSCGACGATVTCSGACSGPEAPSWNGIPVGESCSVGVGACARTGTVVCAGPSQATCNASPGAPDSSFHTTAAPNGSWDWDCDGTVELSDTTPVPTGQSCTVDFVQPNGTPQTCTGEITNSNNGDVTCEMPICPGCSNTNSSGDVILCPVTPEAVCSVSQTGTSVPSAPSSCGQPIPSSATGCSTAVIADVAQSASLTASPSPIPQELSCPFFGGWFTYSPELVTASCTLTWAGGSVYGCR